MMPVFETRVYKTYVFKVDFTAAARSRIDKTSFCYFFPNKNLKNVKHNLKYFTLSIDDI